MGREYQPDQRLQQVIETVETSPLVVNALETVASQLMTRFPDHSGEQLQAMIAQTIEQYLLHMPDWVEARRSQTEPEAVNLAPPEPAFYPIAWIGKADLLTCHPDMEAHILALNDAEVAYIGKKVGDALQETYHLALATILTAYLDVSSDTTPDISNPLLPAPVPKKELPFTKPPRFHIISIQREDLQHCGFSGHEIAQLDEGDMQAIAARMGEWYRDESFWHDLAVITRQVMDEKQQ